MRMLALAVLLAAGAGHLAGRAEAARKHLPGDAHDGELNMKKEDIQRFTDGLRTKEGYLVVGVANHGHLQFAVNYAEGMRRNVGADVPFLVVCLDKRSYTHLKARNISVLRVDQLNTSYSRGEFHASKLQAESLYLEPNYFQLVNLKVEVVFDLVATYNHTVIFNDMDTVWLNPHILEYIHNMFTVWDYDLVMALDNYRSRDWNNGFYVVRPTHHALTALKWCLGREGRLLSGSQAHFNHYYFHVMPAEERLRWGQLPILLFTSGHMWTDRLSERYRVKPFMLHANYAIGMKTKKELLASAGLWYLD